jgi:ubiquinone/menaquinone biosynthesis C-methylase UbiE
MTEPGQMFSDGKTYERMMGRWSKLAGRIFLVWLDPPKNLNWIEVGCGNGAFTEELIARCAPRAVSAVDPSPGQLDFARTRPAAKLAQFSLGDAQALPFPDRSFDAAAMALVITFIPDPAKAVAEMARAVRPGGEVATYMWDTLNGGVPLAPIEAALKAMGKPPSTRASAAASGTPCKAFGRRQGCNRSRHAKSASRLPTRASTISANRTSCRSGRPGS